MSSSLEGFSVRGRGADVEAGALRFFFPLLGNATEGSSIRTKLVELSSAVSLAFPSSARISRPGQLQIRTSHT